MNQTIGGCLALRAQISPNLPAATYEEDGYTWKQLDEISDDLAVQFLHKNVKKGTHVGIWGVNSVSWLAHFFALVKIGAVPVLLNICYREAELQEILAYADVELLCRGIRCKTNDYAQVLAKLDFSRLPRLREVLELEAPSLQTPHQLPRGAADEALLAAAKMAVTPRDTACMMFTSGTTARAKGVMLSHNSLVNNSLAHAQAMHWGGTDKICMCVPLFHCFGITAEALAAMHCGAGLQLVKYYSSREVLRVIETYRCTVLSGVPSMFFALIRNQDFINHDLSSLKSGIVAGSALSKDDYRLICETLGMQKLQPAYGQTESSPCITLADWNDSLQQKAGCAGRAIPNVEVCIWNNQADCPVTQPNGCGEIRTRGYHVMQGYYNLPQATAAAITPQGWLKTGDLGYLDETGRLFITDRIKDIIIRGGENISPAEVERCISRMAQVQQVHVIGLPAKVMQEEVVACICCKPEMMLTAEQVRCYAAQRLAAYKVPQQVVFVEKFPTTSNGKVSRQSLKAMAQQLLASGQNHE